MLRITPSPRSAMRRAVAEATLKIPVRLIPITSSQSPLGDLERVPARADAGVVDEHVDRSQRPLAVVQGRLDVGSRPDVANGRRHPAEGGERFVGPRQSRGIAVEEKHGRTLREEGTSCRVAHPARIRAAGNEHGLAVEPAHRESQHRCRVPDEQLIDVRLGEAALEKLRDDGAQDVAVPLAAEPA